MQTAGYLRLAETCFFCPDLNLQMQGSHTSKHHWNNHWVELTCHQKTWKSSDHLQRSASKSKTTIKPIMSLKTKHPSKTISHQLTYPKKQPWNPLHHQDHSLGLFLSTRNLRKMMPSQDLPKRILNTIVPTIGAFKQCEKSNMLLNIWWNYHISNMYNRSSTRQIEF